MSREYTVKLSEEEILRISYWFVAKEAYQGLDLEDEPLANKLTKAKDKKYTNFDKIKDEMTIETLTKKFESMHNVKDWIEYVLNINKELGCNSCIDEINSNCKKCISEWLEKEVEDD